MGNLYVWDLCARDVLRPWPQEAGGNLVMARWAKVVRRRTAISRVGLESITARIAFVAQREYQGLDKEDLPDSYTYRRLLLLHIEIIEALPQERGICRNVHVCT